MSQPQDTLPSPQTLAHVHQLKVTLRDVRPTVWRRLRVSSDTSLGDLSDVLQEAFGWDGDHLHQFEVRGTSYGPPELMDDGVRDEDDAELQRVAPRPGAVLDYTYDFGDDWVHRIEVEQVLSANPDEFYPCCTGGHGLAPEEDTGAVRSGSFDTLQVDALNDAFVNYLGAMTGAQLPTMAGDEPDLDAVFTGLFLDLADDSSQDCDCDECACGQQPDEDEATVLRPYQPVPDDDLAELAAASPLVRRALALAHWVGQDRALTPSHLLRPTDARQAVAELGLAQPVLPVAGDPWLEQPTQHHTTPAAAVSGKAKLRSAKDLPALHAVWSAAVDAGLIDLRDGTAHLGQSAHLWDGQASAQDRLESWARLLAGFLQARLEATHHDRSYRTTGLDQLLPASAPLLYTVARDPIPAMLPALLLTAADSEGVLGNLGLSQDLFHGVGDLVQDWALAGMIEEVDPETATARSLGGEVTDSALDGLLAESRAQAEPNGRDTARGLDWPAHLAEVEQLRRTLASVVEAMRTGTFITLTPLGDYGLQRILTAHGFHVPVVGDCADVAPADLLDRLYAYLPEDAQVETQVWLAARGAQWEPALREIAETARTSDRTQGPVRRMALQFVLQAAGPRAAALLDSYAGDPWLSAVVSAARHALDLGPEPTQAEQLWLAIDELSEHLGAPAEELLEAANESTLTELLTQGHAITTALTVSHPHALETLQVAAGALDNPQLARELRQALQTRTAPRVQPRKQRGLRRR